MNFIKWCVTDGQDMAEDLGYASLPKDGQTKVLEKLKTIIFDGAAAAEVKPYSSPRT